MHAAYIEAESRLKRHGGPEAPREREIERERESSARESYRNTGLTISLGKAPLGHTPLLMKRSKKKEGDAEVSEALAHVELVLSGRGFSSAKGLERLILLKEYMARLFLPGRIRAAGTAF